MQNHITIKNPACYDLDPYIGRYCEYTSIDEPDRPFYICRTHRTRHQRRSNGTRQRRKLGVRIYRSNKRNKNLYVKASAPDFPGLLFLPGFCILNI